MINIDSQPKKLFLLAVLLCGVYLIIFTGSMFLYPQLPGPDKVRLHIAKKGPGSYFVVFKTRYDLQLDQTYKIKCLVGSEYRFFDLAIQGATEKETFGTVHENGINAFWKQGEDVPAVIFIRKKSKKPMLRLLFK